MTDSIKQGFSRFGWSYIRRCDLRQLEDMACADMDEDQAECYNKASFLLQVQPGDWVVHINVPCYGACMAAQVVRGYEFDTTFNECDDFRHTLQIDLNTLVEFERNDPNVLPVISSRLKLQGRYWRISYAEEFKQSIANLTNKIVLLSPDQRAETYHLRQEMIPLLAEVTSKVQKNNPAGKLEEFVANVLRQVPGVTAVEENGKYKGWRTDNGADLIVHYEAGLPGIGLLRPAKLVVQVKSYVHIHESTEAIDQIKHAIDHFKADSGLIISTAQPSEGFLKAFEAFGSELADKGKTVSLISGNDVARFILKFGVDSIL